MDIKKLLLGGIVAGILFYFLDWLAFEKLFATFFANHPGTVTGLDRTDTMLVYAAAGNLLHGFAISFIFVKSNVKSVMPGFITGGILGFLIGGGIDVWMYGMTTMYSKTSAVADVAIVTCIWAIIGAVAGGLMGMGKKEVQY